MTWFLIILGALALLAIIVFLVLRPGKAKAAVPVPPGAPPPPAPGGGTPQPTASDPGDAAQLHLGDKNPAVRRLQGKLNEYRTIAVDRNYASPFATLTVDGDFGSRTKAAVMAVKNEDHASVDDIEWYCSWIVTPSM